MLTRQIPLQYGSPVKAANITDNTEIDHALDELGIPHPQRTIVLVGGAGGINWFDKFPMRKAVSIVAQLAEAMHAVVIDGGTQAGIMTEMGRQRNQHQYTFPLVGVVFDSLLMREEPAAILDPHHTHFILIPGDDWGDESAWISKIATHVSSDLKSITVLINGGNISRHDVEYSLMEHRPVFVMRGTGRLADEITLTGYVAAVDASQKPEAILELLKSKLA